MNDAQAKLDAEMNEVAETMAKSVKDSKQLLMETLLELGPEGLKKAIPSLSESERETLKVALTSLSKAKSEDADKLTPKKTETKTADMRQESQTGSDDEDEKLMDEANAEHPQQGGPKAKPEGWDGQVIKSAGEGSRGGVVIGHTASGKAIYDSHDHSGHSEFSSDDHKDAKRVIADKRAKLFEGSNELPEKNKDLDAKLQAQQRLHQASSEKPKAKKQSKPAANPASRLASDIDSFRSAMKKSQEQSSAQLTSAIEQTEGLMKSLFPKEEELCVDSSPSTKQQCLNNMTWELDKLRELKNSSWLIRDELPEAQDLFEQQFTNIKKRIKDLAKEYSTLKKSESETVEKLVQLEEAEHKVDIDGDGKIAGAEAKKVEKSIEWAPKNPLAAGTFGRNTHWNVDEYIVKSDEETRATLKKGDYLGEVQGEVLAKSEKSDINDLIEKGQTFSASELQRQAEVQAHKPAGTLVKSFMDQDIARALNISEEEYRKLFGE